MSMIRNTLTAFALAGAVALTPALASAQNMRIGLITPPNHVWSQAAVAMGEDWRQAHPDRALAVTDALAEASSFLNAPGNHAEAAGILSREIYLNQPAALISPVLQGAYRNWAGEDVVDPERIHFGDPTDPTATAWMREQLTRWELA